MSGVGEVCVSMWIGEGVDGEVCGVVGECGMERVKRGEVCVVGDRGECGRGERCVSR